jgi:hypothetical protein
MPGKRNEVFKFSNPLFSTDATTIGACISMFDWAEYRSAKGGMKVHTVLDHDFYLPTMITITPAKVHDMIAAKEINLPKGSILSMDRAYVDCEFFEKLDKKGVFFVTRAKVNMACEVIKTFTVPSQSPGRPRTKPRKPEDELKSQYYHELLDRIKALGALETLKGLEKEGLLSCINVIEALKEMPVEKALELLPILESYVRDKAEKEKKAQERKQIKEAKKTESERKTEELKKAKEINEAEKQPIVEQSQKFQMSLKPQKPQKSNESQTKPQELLEAGESQSKQQEPQVAEKRKRTRNKKKHYKDKDGQIKGKKNADRAKKVKQKRNQSNDIPLFVVIKDEIIHLTNIKKQQESLAPNDTKPKKMYELRRVTVVVFDRRTYTPQLMEFITNNRKLSPNTIALIYQQRWRVEIFFKTIKQNLIVKSFYGTTLNAVHCQLYAAMAAIALLRYLQYSAESKVIWNFSNLVHILRLNLFSYYDIFVWLKQPHCEKRPPPSTPHETDDSPIQRHTLF